MSFKFNVAITSLKDQKKNPFKSESEAHNLSTWKVKVLHSTESIKASLQSITLKNPRNYFQTLHNKSMHFSFKKISFFPSFFQVKWYSYFTLLQFFFAFTINKLLSLSFESIFFGNVRIFMEIIYNRLIYFMFYIIFFVSICGQLGVDFLDLDFLFFP